MSDPGLIVASGYASNQSRETDNGLNTALRIGVSIAGVSDTLVLACMPLTSNADIYASLNFRELL